MSSDLIDLPSSPCSPQLAALREAVGEGEREKETLQEQLLAMRESLSNRSLINHMSTMLSEDTHL